MHNTFFTRFAAAGVAVAPLTLISALLGTLVADGGVAYIRAQARAGFADTVLNLDGVVQARGLGQRDAALWWMAAPLA